MNDATPDSPAAITGAAITGAELAERAAVLRDEVSKAFIGQPEVLDQILIALLAGGHVLIEGVPGLGKTLLVRALAQALELNYARVQFTSDLMPSDVSGHAVYDPKTESFKIRRGPVFTNLLLADEINRAPAKTQSALLEVMQEGQVTIEGKPFELSPPFLTLATQNPVDQEGTYPLPEAQLDRFLLKILIDYPALADIYPQDLLQLFQDSVNAAAPRSVTPYWSDISSSIQSTWHPPSSVNADTPAKSKTFIEEIIKGGKLL
jgi:MoxR-like ATPase